MFICPTPAVQQTKQGDFGEEDYEDAVGDILKQYEIMASNNDVKDATSHVSDEARMAGCLLRYAGHDLMDFRHGDANPGGLDGCLDFSTGDNAGLEMCMRRAKIPEAYANWCHKVSLADFTVIAAEAVMGRTSPTFDAQDPFKEGTLLHTFRENFLVGRKTMNECPWSLKRMPDPEHGLSAMKEVFHDNVFAGHRMPWIPTTALIGAHTLGGATV